MPLKEGDFVLINYTTKVVEDGEEKVIDTTLEDVAKSAGIYNPNRRYEPYPVIIGKSQLLAAVEEALKNMDVGEKKVVEAPPEKAYGPRDERLVRRIPIKLFLRHGRVPRVGEEVDLEVEGRMLRGRVVNVTQRFVYVDFNHPLAGKKLKIELEVVEKVEKDEEKARILVSRVLGVPRDRVKVEKSDGTLKITLPAAVLTLNDLEALLQTVVRDIAEYLSPEKIVFIVEVKLGRSAEEKEEKAEGGESEGEAGEAKESSEKSG